MSSPSISVALCTYNGSRFIREQLQSIAEQTLVPDEVIICDDASSDETASTVEEFAASSQMAVRLVRNQETLGCSRNFEQAIGLCRGELIFLADQDDVWKADKLAAMASAFAEHPGAGYVFSNADLVDESGARQGFTLWETIGFQARNFTPERQVATLLRRNVVTGAALAFRATLRDLVLPIPRAWRHDYWIALVGSVFGYGVPVPQKTFLYRRHLGQHMGCGKDTLGAKVRISLAAEPDYHAQTARIAELRHRVEGRTGVCPPAHLSLMKEKELHLARRALIRSGHGGARLAWLAAEAASGRYQRFSSSWGSMIRDLIAVAPFR